MGYHPGFEDDGIYLTAVKSDLNPVLYPHNSDFFKLQLKATIFDQSVAAFVRWTGIPLAVTELLWQFAAIFLVLFACWTIARKLFAEPRAQWVGVALVAAMFTLPVAGTALNLMDQHLHPRALATGFILLAISAILDGEKWRTLPLLLLAALLHPLMTAFGISFCFFLVLTTLESTPAWMRNGQWASGGSMAEKASEKGLHLGECRKDKTAGAKAQRLFFGICGTTKVVPCYKTGSVLSFSAVSVIFIPLGLILEPPSPSWRSAIDARKYLQLFQWQWYEWLGALAPLLLFWLLWRIARKRGETLLARFALAVLLYGVFHMLLATVILGTPALLRFIPLQPMRFLHLIYFFLVLMAGCLVGKYLLKASVWRWAVFLAAINGGMFLAQRPLFAHSEPLALPGTSSANPWLQAFSWIRQNTPTDAYFALDPEYLAAPEENYHSFRALAERSQLADDIKDGSVVTLLPELAPEWARQVEAQRGWSRFQLADFERLKAEFGVNWALVSYPQPTGLDCKWHNGSLAVCKIP